MGMSNDGQADAWGSDSSREGSLSISEGDADGAEKKPPNHPRRAELIGTSGQLQRTTSLELLSDTGIPGGQALTLSHALGSSQHVGGGQYVHGVSRGEGPPGPGTLP